MSTIDPNDLNARSMARLWMNYTTVKEERDNWREQAEKAEQEIARLQDQLATARGALEDAEYWWSMANSELSEVGKHLKCYDPKELDAIGKVRNVLDQLAAIPTSALINCAWAKFPK